MVNLQTVVLGMPGVSCDPQANIMVLMCVTRWEFWQNGAIKHTTYKFDYGDKWNRDLKSARTCSDRPQKVPRTSS